MYDFIASEVQSLQVQLTVNRLPSGVAPESRGQRQHQQTPATQSAVVNHTKEFRQVFSVCGIAAFLISWRSRPTRLLRTGQLWLLLPRRRHLSVSVRIGLLVSGLRMTSKVTVNRSLKFNLDGSNISSVTTATATAAAGIPSATILLIK